jgi:nitroreductase
MSDTRTFDTWTQIPPVDPRPVVLGGVLVDAPWDQRTAFALAGLACSPSVHNTQPWAVRLLDRQRLEIWADETRWLSHLDPRQRQLHISLGCAMHGLAVAAGAAGLVFEREKLPEGPGGPAYRVTLGHGAAPSLTHLARAAALADRRTVRSAFSEQAVSDPVRRALVHAVAAHRTRVVFIGPGVQMRELGRLTRTALWEQGQDPALGAEIERWSRGALTTDDGVPETAWAAPASLSHPMPHRDFALGRQPDGGWPEQIEAAPPLVAVLSVDRDDARGWLDAGETLHELLLAAWQVGLVGCPIDAAVEVPDTNRDVRHLFSLDGVPQVVLRLGYRAGSLPPPTPRRLLSDLVAV